MKVIISGYCWMPLSELSVLQRANLRRDLTIYPRKTTDIATKEAPEPIELYKENNLYFGVPRSFYLKNKKSDNDEVLEVSYGEKMSEETLSVSNYRSDGPFKEQEDVIRKFLSIIEDREWAGFILSAGCAFGKCCRYDTLVSTNKGLQRIGDIVPDLDDDEILDDSINVDGFYGKNQTSGVYAKKIAPCVKVTTSQGYQVSGTYVHPVLVLSDSGFLWKKLKDVEVGDYLVGKTYDLSGEPCEWPDNDIGLSGKISEDDAYLLGLLTGDGCVLNGRVQLSSIDEEIRKFFIKYLDKLGMKIHVYNNKPADMIVGKGAKLFSEALKSIGLSMTKSYYKKIPSNILCGGKEIARAFIQGLMDTDGSVHKKLKFIEITSSSEDLLRELQILLLGFGVKSGVNLKSGRYKGNKVYHWRLMIHFGDFCKYVDNIGFRLKRKKIVAESIVNDIRNKVFNPNIFIVPVKKKMKLEIDRIFDYKKRRSFKNYTSGRHNPSRFQVERFSKEAHLDNRLFWKEVKREDLFFDNVVSVDDDGEHRVCDLSVPNGRNFIANGLIVHNTYTAIEFARRLGYRTLIVVHKEFLVNQWRKRIKAILPNARVGIVQQNKCQFRDKDFVIGMVHSLSKDDKYPKELYTAFGLAIYDECISGDALIETDRGLQRMEHIINGRSSHVLSFNKIENKWEYKRILRRFIKGTKDTLKIETHSGKQLKVTHDHLVMTYNGWTEACKLKSGDKILSPDYENFGKKISTHFSALNEWRTTFDEVKKVDVSSNVDVYDIEVEDNHNFVANGLLVHNCHRVSAHTWSAVAPMFNAAYKLGLSATPRRKDGAEDVFFQHIGPIAYTARTNSAVPKIRRIITDATLKPISRGQYKVPAEKLNSAQVINQLAANKFRTRQIVEDIVQAVAIGKKVMVISERLMHLKNMAEDLNNMLFRIKLEFTPVVDFYTGDWFSGEVYQQTVRNKSGRITHKRGELKKVTRSEFDLEKAERANAIFASKQIIEEGSDIESLDVIVLATPISDVEQTVGRVRRWCLPDDDRKKCKHLCPWRWESCEGKKQPFVVDVVDEKIPFAMRRWRKRLSFYRSIKSL